LCSEIFYRSEVRSPCVDDLSRTSRCSSCSRTHQHPPFTKPQPQHTNRHSPGRPPCLPGVSTLAWRLCTGDDGTGCIPDSLTLTIVMRGPVTQRSLALPVQDFSEIFGQGAQEARDVSVATQFYDSSTYGLLVAPAAFSEHFPKEEWRNSAGEVCGPCCYCPVVARSR
jgi:hypothetical protein